MKNTTSEAVNASQLQAEEINDLIKFHQNTATGLESVEKYLTQVKDNLKDEKYAHLLPIMESYIKGLEHTKKFHLFTIQRLTENLDEILSQLTETLT